jgi:hypothetical protein
LVVRAPLSLEGHARKTIEKDLPRLAEPCLECLLGVESPSEDSIDVVMLCCFGGCLVDVDVDVPRFHLVIHVHTVANVQPCSFDGDSKDHLTGRG